MEFNSVAGSIQQFKASTITKTSEDDTSTPHWKVKFRRLVRKVIWKIQGDILKSVRNHFLDNDQILQGYHDQVNPTALYSFRLLCRSLSTITKLKYQELIMLRVLDLSGCNMIAHFTIELSDAIKTNTSIEFLSLANCNLSAFSLSCIFQAMSHNLILTGINLMNNQCFDLDAVEDFCEYVLKGKTNLNQIILTHCNIDNYLLQIIFRNLHHLKTLKYLKLNLMSFNSEGLLGLSSALLNFKGKQQLDYLDLSYNYINDEGIILLNNSLAFNYSDINIYELNLSRNGLSQRNTFAINALESVILKFKNLCNLDLSRNSIEEFSDPKFLEIALVHILYHSKIKLDLSRNIFSEFPMNFFFQVSVVDLSQNQIRVRGAYHISQILSRVRTQWKVLNLNDNFIMNDGFISIIYALAKFNKTLETLQVANNILDGHAVLNYISNHELLNLKSIDLSRNLFRYQLVFAILHMMKESPLTLIKFANIKFQKDELQLINEKELLFEIKSSNLRFIDFSQNPLMIHSILRSLSSSYVRIESINLAYCDLVKNDSITFLIKFLQRAVGLQNLNLSGNQIGKLTGENLRNLMGQFGQCISLKYLNLQRNQIRYILKGLLFQLQYLTNLQELDLCDNMIDDSSHSQLQQFFELSHVRILNLSKNYLSMQSLEAMQSAFNKNTSIQVLNLSQNRLNGQHLMTLDKLIERDVLRVLNLSCNNQLDRLKSFFYTKIIPVINSLTLSNLQYDQRDFNLFLRSIKENRRVIQSIDVENTPLQSKQLKLFLMSIHSTKQLKNLSLQYVSFNDDYITGYIIEHMMPTLKRLSRLSLVRCIISEEMWSILLKLVESTQYLLVFDLSGNFFDLNNSIYIRKLIQNTKTIEHLILQRCNINDQNIYQLIEALDSNHTIEILDISLNTLSYQGIQAILNVKNLTYDQKLRSIILSGCLQNELDESSQQMNLEHRLEATQQLMRFDLSDNNFSKEAFFQIILSLSDRQRFPKLQYLNLSKSSLGDQNCESLATLLSYSNLTDLNLSCNQIGDKGLQIIFEALKEKRVKLQLLNLKKNLISKLFFVNLQGSFQIHSLRVLNIAHNFTLISSEFSKAFSTIYKNNPNLFIYNYWCSITEELARQIVLSYINLCKNFKFNISSIPQYLKVLKIENSEITDGFCTYFADQYYNFPYLETLSFCNSPAITKYGKIYLYITIFQDCYQNFALKHFYFNEERNFSTIFDDGVWNYILIKLKFWLQQVVTIQSEKSQQEKYDEILPIISEKRKRWGMMGSFLIYKINKSLQTNDQHFTFSSNFMRFMIQNQSKVKVFAVIHSILHIALIGVSAMCFIGITAPSAWAKIAPIFKSSCQKQASQGQLVCFLDSGLARINLLYSIAVAIISLSLLSSTIDLFIAIQVRKNANPDYKVLSPQTNNYLKRSLPHMNEFLLYLFTILVQMNYFFAFNQIFAFQAFSKTLLVVSASKNDLEYDLIWQSMADRSLNSTYALSFVILFKLLYQNLSEIIAIRQILRLQPDTQRATYLNAFWKKCLHEHNYVLDSFLCHFCPQSGVKLFKAYFTQQQIHNFIQAFLIELPQIIFTLIYISDTLFFLRIQIGMTAIPLRQTFVLIGLFKNCTQFYLNFYRGFTTKHPKIKQQEFNQALFFRRFWQSKQLSIINFNQPCESQYQQSPVLLTPKSQKFKNFKKRSVQFSKKQIQYLKKSKTPVEFENLQKQYLTRTPDSNENMFNLEDKLIEDSQQHLFINIIGEEN